MASSCIFSPRKIGRPAYGADLSRDRPIVPYRPGGKSVLMAGASARDGGHDTISSKSVRIPMQQTSAQGCENYRACELHYLYHEHLTLVIRPAISSGDHGTIVPASRFPILSAGRKTQRRCLSSEAAAR
jgi:hypothetical protein